MGYSLKSTTTKSCGCVVREYEHDDFPGTNDDVKMCEGCRAAHAEQGEKRRSQATRWTTLKAEFLAKAKDLPTALVPIKAINTIRSGYPHQNYNYGDTFDDMTVFAVQKVKNRWHINEPVVKLFFDMGLDEYYYFPKSVRTKL